jgi:hypothetical protein
MDFFDAPFEFDAYPDQQPQFEGAAAASGNNQDSSFSSGADFAADDGTDACSPLDWNKIAADLPAMDAALPDLDTPNAMGNVALTLLNGAGSGLPSRGNSGSGKAACLPLKCPFVCCQLVSADLASFITHLQQHSGGAAGSPTSDVPTTETPSMALKKRSHQKAFEVISIPRPLAGSVRVGAGASTDLPFSLAFMQEPPTEPSEWLSRMVFEPAVSCTIVDTVTGMPAFHVGQNVKLVWRLFDAHNNEVTHDGALQGHESLLSVIEKPARGIVPSSRPWQPRLQPGMAVAHFPEMRINYHCSCRSPTIITQHYHLMVEAVVTGAGGDETRIASSFVRDHYPNGPVSRVQIKVRRLKPEWRDAALGPFADHSACSPCHCCEGGGKKKKL